MKSIVKFLPVVLLLTLMLSTGCRKTDDKDSRPVLAVSIEPQRQMLEQLAGDNFRIITLMPNGENPETYEISPVRRMELEKAKAYFVAGNLLFEENIKMSMKNTSNFVDTSEGIDLIYGTHSHPGEHPNFLPGDEGEHDRGHLADPHVWSSVKNARKIARRMSEVLINLDKENADEYSKRLQAYDQHLDSLDRAFTQKLDTISDKSFFIWHPSLSYFARDYGLEQIPFGYEHKEMSADRMGEIMSLANQKNAKYFIYQSQLDGRPAEVIKNNIDVEIIPFNGLAYDWEDELSKVVDGLSKR